MNGTLLSRCFFTLLFFAVSSAQAQQGFDTKALISSARDIAATIDDPDDRWHIMVEIAGTGVVTLRDAAYQSITIADGFNGTIIGGANREVPWSKS